MDENRFEDLSELYRQAEEEAKIRNRFEDIFLARIEDIEFCLEQERYIAALSAALTLPDICGKAEFKSEKTVAKRYIKWYNQFMDTYKRPTSKYAADMPYLSGEVVFNLRNAFLHSGNPNITKADIKNVICKVDKFELLIGKTYIMNVTGSPSNLSTISTNLSLLYFTLENGNVVANYVLLANKSIQDKTITITPQFDNEKNSIDKSAEEFSIRIATNLLTSCMENARCTISSNTTLDNNL